MDVSRKIFNIVYRSIRSMLNIVLKILNFHFELYFMLSINEYWRKWSLSNSTGIENIINLAMTSILIYKTCAINGVKGEIWKPQLFRLTTFKFMSSEEMFLWPLSEYTNYLESPLQHNHQKSNLEGTLANFKSHSSLFWEQTDLFFLLLFLSLMSSKHLFQVQSLRIC